jgi:hypothetical protein
MHCFAAAVAAALSEADITLSKQADRQPTSAEENPHAVAKEEG